MNNIHLDELYASICTGGALCVDFLGRGEPRAFGAFPTVTSERERSAASVDRLRGCLIGVGIGDALGRLVEGVVPPKRQRIEYYQRWKRWASGPAGVVSGDTQMTMWLAESTVGSNGFDPANFGDRIGRERIRGAGRATELFVRNMRERRLPWHQARGPHE